MSSKSQRMQTFDALVAAYKELSPDALAAHMDSTFTHQTYPQSLGMPERSLDDFRKHAVGITSVFTTFSMRPQRVFEDDANNEIVAYCHMGGDLTRGLGDWLNETILMVKFNADGTKVTELKEFVDSAKAKLLREKLMGSMDQNMDVNQPAS